MKWGSEVSNNMSYSVETFTQICKRLHAALNTNRYVYTNIGQYHTCCRYPPHPHTKQSTFSHMRPSLIKPNAINDS